MCLSIPAKVVSIDGQLAKVSIGGNITNAGLHLVDDVQIGDYVLLHSGYIIQKINEEEANETIQLLKELKDKEEG